MKPAQVSEYLRKIAAAINNSREPRRDLVIADLKQIVAAINPNDVPPWAEDKPTKEQRRRIKEDLGEEPYEAKRDTEIQRKQEGWPDEPTMEEELDTFVHTQKPRFIEKWEKEGKDPRTIERLWEKKEKELRETW